MRYLALIAFLTLVFLATDRLSEPYFQKQRELREILHSQKTAPKIFSHICGYCDIVPEWPKYCPQCGKERM